MFQSNHLENSVSYVKETNLGPRLWEEVLPEVLHSVRTLL